jgi:hypothetical protein
MYRVTQNSIQQGLARSKSHVNGAYQTGRHWAGMLDSAFNTGRKIDGVVAPLLNQHGVGRKLTGLAANALMSYDQVRGEVLGGHDKAHSLLASLKKAAPEIGL